VIDLTLFLKCPWTAHHLSTLLSSAVNPCGIYQLLGFLSPALQAACCIVFPALTSPWVEVPRWAQLCSRLCSCSCPDFASCHPHHTSTCCVDAVKRLLQHVKAWAFTNKSNGSIRSNQTHCQLSLLKPLVEHYTEPGWRCQPCVMVAGRKTWRNLPARWPRGWCTPWAWLSSPASHCASCRRVLSNSQHNS
jgi:hypothetical protein